MIVWSYSGVRPLYDDGAAAAQEATRDYVLTLDAPAGGAALLNVFGGKITTYRRLAEAALTKLSPFLPVGTGRPAGWTARAALPGGDFPIDGFSPLLASIRERWPFLSERTARRFAHAYGTRVSIVLDEVRGEAELGRTLGADLTEAELRYLVRHEWAMTAEDVLWRRSKLGLRVTAAEVEAVARAMEGVRDAAQ